MIRFNELTGTNGAFHLQEKSGRCVFSIATVLLALFSVVPTAEATHFRYGHIFWRPGDGNAIDFTIQNAWRRNQGTCRDPNNPSATVPCTGPGGLAGVGDIHSQGVSSPVFHFGDGNTFSFPGGLLHLVTSIDVDNNWYFGMVIDHTKLPNIVTTISHTYAAPGNYLAVFPDCCRISPSVFPNRHINNPDGSTRIETIVNVGTGNRSPVSVMPPIVSCPIESDCAFTVQAVDQDGDPLRFRLATGSESGLGRQPGPPNAPNSAAINPVTGLYTWDTRGASLGGVDPEVWNVLYSTQVIIEDLDAGGNAKSKVALDFFIRLVPDVGEPPIIDPDPDTGEPPVCFATKPALVGSTLTFIVSASDPDPDDLVTLTAVGLPAGPTTDPPLPAQGNPVLVLFSWTPTASDVGSHVVRFTATDTGGQQAECPVTIDVEDRRLRFIEPVEPWERSGFAFGHEWLRTCVTQRSCDPNAPRPFKHVGVDAGGAVGTPIRASERGQVVFVSHNIGAGWGGAIVIEHSAGGDLTTTVTTLYLHVDPLPAIKEGVCVDRSQEIATIAPIASPHLHFGIRRFSFNKSNPSPSLRGALPPEGTTDCLLCFSRPVPLPPFPEHWVDPEAFFAPESVPPSGICGPPATASPTGYFYPLNYEIPTSTNWLACDDEYLPCKCHLGADINGNGELRAGTPVYAIARGKVLRKSASAAWGAGNTALAILHQGAEGPFVAVYGHIRTELKQKDCVEGGTEIGQIGPYPAGGDHLHFGIKSGRVVPAARNDTDCRIVDGRCVNCCPKKRCVNFGWGRMDSCCLNGGFTNDFVDPIEWINMTHPAFNVDPCTTE